MPTDCSATLFDFAPVEGRAVVASFDGGAITTDAGALLLGATDKVLGLSRKLAACFKDGRNPAFTEHAVETLVMQRVVGIALGYEDLNDHDQLRYDPIMAVLANKLAASRSDCAPVAGKSTLNRLELSKAEPTRYNKIAADTAAIEALFVDLFLDAHAKPPAQITLDLDATDDPLHGHQEGRFFHGYYDCYCYLPLYIFCGEHLLCAKLRPSDIDAAAGAVKQVARIVEQIRITWPQVRIILRGDSGFCRENLMRWCEDQQVDYVFGLAKNKRLTRILGQELQAAKLAFEATQQPARVFKDFTYRTQKSWSRERRVVGKAEHLAQGANPRFVVTSLAADREPAQPLYEKRYCGRGEMENRIKEQQLYLFADRTSCHSMRANQLRLWVSSAAYVLLAALRQYGLKNTSLQQARCDTIRLKLLKLGAVVRVTVRRVWFALAESCPYQALFAQVLANLRSWQSQLGPAARRAQLAPA